MYTRYVCVVIICRLGEATFKNPRSPSSGATLVLTSGIAKAAVWAERGTVACGLGGAVLKIYFVCLNSIKVKGHHYHHH